MRWRPFSSVMLVCGGCGLRMSWIPAGSNSACTEDVVDMLELVTVGVYS
jgi:hypothetical protein